MRRLSGNEFKWGVVLVGAIWALVSWLWSEEPAETLDAPFAAESVVGSDVIKRPLGAHDLAPAVDESRAVAIATTSAEPKLQVAEPSPVVGIETQALLVLCVLDAESGEEQSEFRLVAGETIYKLRHSLHRPTEAVPADRIYRLPPDQELLLVTSSEGFATETVWLPPIPAGAKHHETVELHRAATLRWTVVDQQGASVERIRVFVCDGGVDPVSLFEDGVGALEGHFGYPARNTIADGWMFDRAPRGTLYLHAGMDGEHLGTLKVPDLQPGETRDGLVLRVDKVEPATLTVLLREPQGVPTGDLVLMCDRPNFGSRKPQAGKGTSDGRRELVFRDLKPGSYRLGYDLYASSAADDLWPERLELGDYELAPAEARVVELDLSPLIPPTRRVRLVEGGQPVSGELVYALSRDGPYLRRRSAGVTDTEGWAQLPGLSAGAVHLQIEPAGRPPAVFRDVRLDVDAALAPTLELSYSSGTLQLLDAKTGAPLGETEVKLWPAGGYSVSRRFTTDIHGRIELEAADGEHFVQRGEALGVPFGWDRGASEPRAVEL